MRTILNDDETMAVRIYTKMQVPTVEFFKHGKYIGTRQYPNKSTFFIEEVIENYFSGLLNTGD